MVDAPLNFIKEVSERSYHVSCNRGSKLHVILNRPSRFFASKNPITIYLFKELANKNPLGSVVAPVVD
jgi:hypothetical protein